MRILILVDIIQWLQANQLGCPVKKYLHISCPGCGLQRSFIALLQGDIPESVQYHPATIPLLLLFLFSMLQLIFKLREGNKIIVYLFLLVATIVLSNYIYRIVYSITA